MCRDRALKEGREGFIWTAGSEDKGITWSSLERTSLPNPDSAMDVADLGQRYLVMFYNHSATVRFPLSIANYSKFKIGEKNKYYYRDFI